MGPWAVSIGMSDRKMTCLWGTTLLRNSLFLPLKQIVSAYETTCFPIGKNQELPYYQYITMLLISKVALKMTMNVQYYKISSLYTWNKQLNHRKLTESCRNVQRKQKKSNENCTLSSQTGVAHQLSMPTQGDLVVDGKWLFEVGGKNKGFSQIKNVENSFVVSDKIDIGHGDKIPLWLFGLLY